MKPILILLNLTTAHAGTWATAMDRFLIKFNIYRTNIEASWVSHQTLK